MKKIKISLYPPEIFKPIKSFKFTAEAEIDDDQIIDYDEEEPSGTSTTRSLYEEQLIEVPIDEIKVSSPEADTTYKDENNEEVDTSEIVTDTGETLVYDAVSGDWTIKTSDSESSTTTKAIHSESETFEEDRHEDTPEEKTARSESLAGHPNIKAQRAAARQEVHEGKNEALKDKWRRDVYEGAASSKTEESFKCEEDQKDCRGECSGDASLDPSGKCCSEDEKDCAGYCFGPSIVANRYIRAGEPVQTWVVQRCCDPNQDINCCTPGELNCKNVCPNGVHPNQFFERLSQYIQGIGGCCHPDEPGCCLPSEYNPCANPRGLEGEPGYIGACAKDATSAENQKVFMGFYKKSNGNRGKSCCDPQYSDRCCTDEMKKCGYCPSDPEFDFVHPDNDCCNEQDTLHCCPKSQSHCGKCKKHYSQEEWDNHKNRHKIINGECYDCHAIDCNTLCEDSEKKCGQCPGSPEYNNWHLINPNLPSTPENCCHESMDDNCCSKSQRDCRGICDGGYIIGNKGNCCEPHEHNSNCCPTFDACGNCQGEHDYSASNIINYNGVCCDTAHNSPNCCEELDCCGLCNKYSYNSENKCVDSNGAQCTDHL